MVLESGIVLLLQTSGISLWGMLLGGVEWNEEPQGFLLEFREFWETLCGDFFPDGQTGPSVSPVCAAG